MRLATYNVENMFRRPKALNTPGWGTRESRSVLIAYAELEGLFQKAAYSAADKKRILTLMGTLELLKDDESKWAFLRRSRGQLLRRPRKEAPVEVVANGRADWIGWLELKREAVNEVATRNTARVLADLDADVMAVIEAEDRLALDRFNTDVLPFGFKAGSEKWSFRHVMLVDGNDKRGIDVGLLTKDGFPIERVRSHVDDRNTKGTALFSRDCPEYEVSLPSGAPLLVLANHFKSKGYGAQKNSDATRLSQARRVAEIYSARRAEGWELIAVLGDLNDTPDSKPLKPIIQNTDLRDVSDHEAFEHDAREGTYGTGNDKIDYALLSPALFERVTGGGVNRRGVWRGPRVRNPWPMFDTITSDIEQASDHAAVWADLDI